MIVRPDIFLKSLSNFGGETFGTGVTLYIFHKSGQIPEDMDRFLMFFNGIAICPAKSMMTVVRILPGGTDFPVLIPSSLFFTYNFGNCGMDDDSNDRPMVPYHTCMPLSQVVYPTHGVWFT